MSNNSRLVFLLGAGISIPANFPKTSEITQMVLSGNGVIYQSDGVYYLSENSSDPSFTREYISRITVILKRLKREVDFYYKDIRETNYEDIYYLAAQIRDSELGEYDNPALNALIDEISIEIEPVLKPNENEIRKEWTLFELIDEACNYIYDVVWHSLVISPENLNYLSSIFDACFDNTLSHVDICTLNHDTLLEQFLENNPSNKNIDIVDGFGQSINESRFWDSSLFLNEKNKVRLLKLHGSINWFKVRNEYGNERVVIPPQGWDIDAVRDSQGRIQRPAGRRPLFLAGTFNKMLGYTQSVFTDLYCHFHNSLYKTDSLIVCGYSFNDKGINTQIAEWLFAKRQNRIFVIHSDAKELIRSARGAISKNWREWQKNHQLITIPKMIEDVSWKEISSYMERNE